MEFGETIRRSWKLCQGGIVKGKEELSQKCTESQ